MPDGISPLRLPLQLAAWLPIGAGLVSALLYAWIWGGLNASPAIIDEAAYLMQAQIYASGHWTAPARPLPQFFEQLYVFVTPFLAAKYPPGHPLILTLGVLVGSPALIVLLLNAIAGGLVFRLVARRWGLLTASLTWLIWVLAPINLTFRPSYLSNVTTSALWLVAWWALERWWETSRRRWLLLLAVAVGWCAVTRPLTGLALSAPLGMVVLRRTIDQRLWKDLGLALLSGAMVLSLLPLANRKTTGRWLEMPWTTYSKLYTPYDHLGFGFDTTPPLKPYSPELKRLVAIRRPISERHTLAALPSIAYERIREIFLGTLGRGRASLIPFAAVGLFFLCNRASFALLSSLLLIVVYLAYAHHARWTPYYLETLPTFAFLAALALSQLGRWPPQPGWKILLAAGTWIFFALWLVSAIAGLPRSRLMGRMARRPYDAFRATLERIPDSKAIVFVRRNPRHTLGQSLVFNEPDLDRARLWIVHDFGPADAQLVRLAPDRVPYLYDEDRRKLAPLALGDSPTRPQRRR